MRDGVNYIVSTLEETQSLEKQLIKWELLSTVGSEALELRMSAFQSWNGLE
jgi:hypothetical protein